MRTIDIYRSDQGRQAVAAAYEEVLRRWPVPAQRLTVPTRLGDTFIVASGAPDRPPLVLLHGSSTNATIWMGDVPVWAEHFRVFAVDVVGEPGGSAPARPPLGSADYADWLDDVFDALGLTQAAVLGASLGGWLALDYATRRPERVSRLVLLCPGGVGRQRMGWLLPVLLLRPFGAWGRRRSMEIITGLDGAQVRPFLDHMSLILRHFRPRTQRLPIFSDDALATLTMPVLAIVGERDAMLDSHATVRRLRKAVPHAVTTLLPGVGHAIIGQAVPILRFLSS